jgi:type I restriction enzyme S subunit
VTVECVLKDLIAVSKDGEWGKSEPFDDSVEMLAIRGTDFEDVRFGFTASTPRRHIAKRHADRKLLQPWDVIIEAAGGTKNQITGRTVLLRPQLFSRSELPFTCASFSRFIRFNTELCDPAFMFWYLQHLYASGLMHAYHTQHTGVARFQWTTFSEREPLELPPLPVQRRIAGILSAYDELMENNQRRIRILEEMARALYREWFVHFRFPGHEKLPRVASSLGDIPRGWEAKRVPECVDIDPRVVVSRDGEKPFVPMGCLANDSMLITDIESRDGNSGAKFQNGDTLFARITPCLENGKTGFVQFLPDAQVVACGSTEFIVLRSRTLTPEFVYLLARSDEFRGNAIKSMSGASGRQRVQERCFDDFKIAHPPRAVLDRFSAIVAPSFRMIQKLHLQIQNLRRTRDLLLPRLLSGNCSLSV